MARVPRSLVSRSPTEALELHAVATVINEATGSVARERASALLLGGGGFDCPPGPH